MWVFLNNAFVSIVEDRDEADLLWVRARVQGDLERFFKPIPREWRANLVVDTTPEADYLFRSCVPRAWVRAALSSALDGVDYDNFKGSIPKNKMGDVRHTFYMRVWNAMMAYQKSLRPRSGYWQPLSKRYWSK
jgi:hypothetical protein